jgi:nitroimidazol reductase NimA-like FMN-containing flavoprotein (pyridoxamine 5'-phosphate oxidase superfamily)
MRAHYDRETVHGILDAGYVAHVAFMGEAGPVAMPMFYVRDGESVLLHGSRTSRFMRVLGAGAPLCLTVTLIDGLVLARSAFHHSMNYRSVMAHGRATIVPAEEKLAALALFVERVEAGRSRTARAPNAQEL